MTPMRRWLVIIVVLLIALLGAGAVAVQIVLNTDLPRRMVLDALEDQTGLRYGATSLDVSWGGMSVLRDLTVALPLENQPFARVPLLQLTHTDLIRLAMFREPIVDTLVTRAPEVWLHRDVQGQWNVQQAVEIVQQRLASRERESGEMQPLPELDVLEATLHVADAAGDRATYGAISLRGEPADSLAWMFELSLQGERLARGRVAPTANWAHEIEFDLDHLQQLVEPWLNQPPPVLKAAGRWRGRIEGSSVRGTLAFDALRVDTLSMQGETAVTFAEGRIELQPIGLALEHVDAQWPPIVVQSGVVVADVARQSLAVSRLLIEGFDLAAELEGGWTQAEEAVWANVQWAGQIERMDGRHEGAMDVHVQLPLTGQRVINADVQSYGSTTDGHWDGRWQIEVRGENWKSMRGTVQTPQLMIVAADESFDARGLTARFATRWPIVEMTHLELPGGRTSGQGVYDAAEGTWSLDMLARQWNLPRVADPLTPANEPLLAADVHLQAAGTRRQVNLDRLTISTAGSAEVPAFELSAGGVYRSSEPQPLRLRVIASSRVEQEAIQSDLDADVLVSGSLRPLDLQIAGDVNATQCRWEDRLVDDLAISLEGVVQPGHVAFGTTQFVFLDGQWTVAGRYDMPSGYAEATLVGSGTSLERALGFINVPLAFTGQVAADLHLELPQLDAQQLRLVGQWQLDDLHGHGLDAAAGRGDIELYDQVIQLNDIELAQREGTLAGHVRLNLDEVDRLAAELEMQQWELHWPDYALQATVHGRAVLDLDAAEMVALAGSTVDVHADFVHDDQAFGELHASALLDGRTASIQQLQLTGLGGQAEGSGVVHLTSDGWYSSTLDLSWAGIDLSVVPIPQTGHDLSGLSSGSLRIAQADDSRAPGPMQVDLSYRLSDGAYGPFTLGDGYLTGFLDTRRLMIQDSRFDIMDGTVDLWGRITEHDGQPFTHVHLQLANLDLQQVADALDYQDRPMPGRIHGQGAAGGYLRSPHRLFGQANLHLTDSDIASAPGVAQLYNALNVDFGSPAPTGEGDVLVRLEDTAIHIARLTYFNRGIDLIASARVLDLREGVESPIEGLVAGTIRPLRDTRLPFIGNNLDRLLSAIQADATTVRISGTVGETETAFVPLSEVTGALGRILRGTVE